MSEDIRINTTVLAIIIALSVVCCLIVVIFAVLIVLCIRYRKRSTIHTPTSLVMSVSAAEAAKFYVVESNGKALVSLKEPTLQTVSRGMISDQYMLDNPSYNKYQVDGCSTPDNVPSPSPLCQTITSNSLGSLISSTDNHASMPMLCESKHMGQPNEYVSPHNQRHESLSIANSCSVTSTSDYMKVPTTDLTRTMSDNQILNQKSQKMSLYGPIYSEPDFKSNPKLPQILHVSPSNVELVRSLGMGQFGQVYLGYTIGLSQKDLGLGESDDKSVTVEVAVKQLRDSAEKSECKAFDKEVKFMSKLRHRGVVQLLGVCQQGQPFILMECMKNGDLQSFLQRYQYINMGRESYGTTISYHALVGMSLQIADAMKYLASCNFIHRDLATRNCLVGENFTVKVADFGLSRNLYDSCYYRLHGAAILPIRWMATECFFGRFSEKSDVWAFGVTMWEIFTLCMCQPHKGIPDSEIIRDALRETNRLLEKPEFCKEDIYSIMKMCWRTNANDRATFNIIYTNLKELYDAMQ